MTVTTRLDEAALRHAFGCFPSGVTAICGLSGETPIGMAVSSFTSVSINPPLVSACVQNTSTTWPRLQELPRLGVSVLAPLVFHGSRFRRLNLADETDSL